MPIVCCIQQSNTGCKTHSRRDSSKALISEGAAIGDVAELERLAVEVGASS
ncbi:hypothetical protein QFZ81_004910 [Paenibacillus sp. V4I9]|uniref:hypothetical protein n=1 Tax=Paenibacillus sp. V4I9 TaxID=3042308 RepID=UPI00278602BA|nr:hypothetical protein [Paenibacillus sp. V4I9]MDQ0889822.1 hypothetical protein [Paenibacillus sp. V4I9]